MALRRQAEAPCNRLGDGRCWRNGAHGGPPVAVPRSAQRQGMRRSRFPENRSVPRHAVGLARLFNVDGAKNTGAKSSRTGSRSCRAAHGPWLPSV